MNKYPVFEANQILSSQHLNNLRDYLDQQNRYTRTRLVGMGIVCGLEVDFIESNGRMQGLKLGGGVGVTSHGHLICLEACELTHYKPYQDKASDPYAPFITGSGEEAEQVDLWELLEADDPDDDSISSLNDAARFVGDKVVLLYVEVYNKDLKSCFGNDCDDKGQECQFTVRKLLMERSRAQQLMEAQTVNRREAGYDYYLNDRFGLPEIHLAKPSWNQGITNYAEVHNAYLSTVTEIIPALSQALITSYRIYKPASDLNFNGAYSNPFGRVQQQLTQLVNRHKGDHIQYVYDFFKDLILAYNELRAKAFDLVSSCCPDEALFPRHLFLGRIPTRDTMRPSSFRQHFLQSPIYNQQKELLREVDHLLQRIRILISFFKVPNIQIKDRIVITPSRGSEYPLGERAIPYYYDQTASVYPKAFWSFDYYRTARVNSILSYFGKIHNQSPQTAEPLAYQTDHMPFYRVEGHVGLNFRDALQTLEQQKKQYGLPIDIVALRFNPESETLALDWDRGFADLQADYIILRSEFICMVQNLIRNLTAIASSGSQYLPKGQSLYLTTNRKTIAQQILAALPDCLREFDPRTFVAAYRSLIASIAAIKLQTMSSMQKLSGKENAVASFISSGLLGYQQINQTLNSLIDNCLYARLTSLYYVYQWRIKIYTANHQSIFSNFTKKHYGLEHLAGVPKGGTFVLVYHDESKDPNDGKVLADFCLPYLCCTEQPDLPLCDEAMTLPPAAKPVFLITTKGKAISFEPFEYSYNLNAAVLEVPSFDKKTSNGGKIAMKSSLKEGTNITYTPRSNFVGSDTFKVTVQNKNNDLQDVIHVFIKVENPPKGKRPPVLDNLDILETKYKDVLDGSSRAWDIYTRTKAYFLKVAEEKKDPAKAKQYANGGKDAEMAREFKKLMDETSKHVDDSHKAMGSARTGLDEGDPDILMGGSATTNEHFFFSELFEKQMDNLMDSTEEREKDLSATNPLFKLLNGSVKKQLDDMKHMKTNDRLKEKISDRSKGRDKPIYKNLLRKFNR